MRLLFLIIFSLFPLASFAQEPAWGTQAKIDSIDARDRRATKKFQETIDKWLITDYARFGLTANTLVKTSPFLQYPAMNPALGGYLANFEKETGATVIIRAYIDIPYFNPWVASYRASQKTRKAFEISRAKPAHYVLDIVYTPTGMKSKYEVAGYRASVRDSLRTDAFNAIFKEADFDRMRDTLQAAMGAAPVQSIDTVTFNTAIIRALEALKGDPGMKPDPGYRVTFRRGDAPGYDAYRWPALNSRYKRDASGNPVPWVAIDAKKAYTLQGRYTVADPAAAAATPLNIEAADLTAGAPATGDTVVTQQLNPAGSARELTAEANYFRANRFGKGVETVAGQIAVAAYEPLPMKLTVVYPKNNKPGFTEIDLQNYLNQVYGQAVVTWTVQFQAFDYLFPAGLKIEKDGGKYSDQMDAAIKAFGKKHPVDKKTCYIFLVPSLAGDATGFMPFKGQFGFVKLAEEPFHTIAHELGHGAFRLRHTFSSGHFVAGQGQTDNLMDYSRGERLYKHQWDLVHDPEAMLFSRGIDEEETMEIGMILPSIDLSEYREFAFLTPSGEAIVIKDIKAGQFNYDGGLLNFSLSNGTQIKSVFVSNPERFIGYYTSSVLSLFPVDHDTQKAQSKLRTIDTEEELKKHAFTGYIFAEANHPAFAYARTKINQAYYSECSCYYEWVNPAKASKIKGIVTLPIIPANASRYDCGGKCDATIDREKYNIQDGLGIAVFEKLWEISPKDKIGELAQLCNWLTSITKGKKYSFYCVNYPKSADISDFLSFLKNKQIFTQQKFNDAFFNLSCRDYDIVFSEIDLWQGINKQTYNQHSIDYAARSKGVEKHYEYSLTDLITRDYHVRLHNSIFASVIQDAEHSGEAQAIAISEGAEQYTAMFGTQSAIFAWGNYFATTMADVMEVGIATEVVRYAGSFITASKQAKDGWLQKILKGLKKLVKSDIVDDLIAKIDDVNLKNLVKALQQNDNVLIKESERAKGRIGIFVHNGDIITEIGHVDGDVLWMSEIRQMDNLPTNATVTKLNNVDVKLLRGESKGQYELVVRETGECFVRKMEVPTSLIEGRNVFRGFVTDYAEAKQIFEQFRTNQILELKKIFSGDVLNKEIETFGKRNLAYFEGKIDNIELRSSDIRISGKPYTGEKIFDAYKVDKYGNVDVDGAWSREFDTEYVGLSEIAQKLGGKRGKIFPNVQGEITIASELPYCISCQGVIQDFANMFPNVKINLIDGLKNLK